MMKNKCDTCKHDKPVGGCELYCCGVMGWDEENEVVTSCQDYEEGDLGKEGMACTEI